MTAGKVIAAGGILGGIVAIGLGTWRLLAGPDRPLKTIEPDLPAAPPPPPPVPGLPSSHYRLVDAIIGKLRAASQATGIPLGLMVGWIAKESGGKLSDTTSLDERGYFQLMPAESQAIGVDHERLSTDSDYSIDAGVKLIRKYQSSVNDLNLPAAPAGNSYYWKLVKLAHSMGASQMRKVVTAAMDADQAGSWGQLENFAVGMSIRGPQPKKWFPFVDLVYKVGKPFGFGSEEALVAGWVPNHGFDLLGVEA